VFLVLVLHAPARWVSSEEQPADRASRRFAREESHDWKRGRRLGEADRSGATPPSGRLGNLSAPPAVATCAPGPRGRGTSGSLRSFAK